MTKKPAPKPVIRPKYTVKHPTVQLALAVLLFFVSVRLSRGAGMQPWEIDVFRFIYGWPDWLRPFFVTITQFGSIYMLALLLLIYVLRRKYHVMLRLFLTGTTAYMASGVAKDLWGRVRPHEFLDNIAALDYVVRGPGFPSGHTAMAAAIGLALAYHARKKYRPLLYILIALIGLSRVYLGVHAPLDIIAGFAIGWACYAVFRHIRLYDTTLGPRAPKPKR